MMIKMKGSALLLLMAVIALPLCLLLFPVRALAKNRNAALKAVLKAYIEGSYHWRDVRIGDLALEGADRHGLPTDIKILEDPPGRTVFDLHFAGGREMRATADVTAYATVIEAKRLLREGSVIGPGDLCAARVDVSGLPVGYFSFGDESSLIGSVFTQSIAPGVVILKEMVSAHPLVRRGQRVNVVLETPAFTITAVGRLERDTRVGQATEVMNVSSGKLLWGVLAGQDTVRIEAGQ